MLKDSNLSRNNFRKQMLLLSLFFRAESHQQCDWLAPTLVSLLYTAALKCLLFHQIWPGSPIRSDSLARIPAMTQSFLILRQSGCEWTTESIQCQPHSLFPVTVTQTLCRASLALLQSTEYEKKTIAFKFKVLKFTCTVFVHHSSLRSFCLHPLLLVCSPRCSSILSLCHLYW